MLIVTRKHQSESDNVDLFEPVHALLDKVARRERVVVPKLFDSLARVKPGQRRRCVMSNEEKRNASNLGQDEHHNARTYSFHRAAHLYLTQYNLHLSPLGHLLPLRLLFVLLLLEVFAQLRNTSGRNRKKK